MRDADPDPTRAAGGATPAGAALPLVIVANPAAGSGDKQAELAAATELLAARGHPHEVCELGGPTLDPACRRAAQRAARLGGVLVAAGGDGTVNAAANAAREAGVALGLLPMGTFNHFAREHGIPGEPAAAAEVLMAGSARPVAMGELNGRLFFNNAGFGLYTEAIRRRERAKQHFGRYRVVAVAAAVGTLLAGLEPFTVHLVADDAAATVRTSTVLVFCSPLQLKTLGLDIEGCAREGALAVALLRPTRLRDRLRLLLRATLKQLDEDGRVQSFCANDFEVRSARREIEVAIDGETVRLRQPLRFRAVPDAVQLIVPGPLDTPASAATRDERA
jgi:diacylglycerol kinase family enzyme